MRKSRPGWSHEIAFDRMIPPPKFHEEVEEKSYFWVYVVLALGVAVILFHYFVLPNILPEWLYEETPVAHAEEPIRQNDYYCAHLSDYVNGGEFVEFCKQYIK